MHTRPGTWIAGILYFAMGAVAYADYDLYSKLELKWTIASGYEMESFWTCVGANAVMCNDWMLLPPGCGFDPGRVLTWNDCHCGIYAGAGAGAMIPCYAEGGGCRFLAGSIVIANSQLISSELWMQMCQLYCPCGIASGFAWASAHAQAWIEVVADKGLGERLADPAWQASLTGGFQEPAGVGERLSRAIVRVGDQAGALWYNDTYRVPSNLTYFGLVDAEEHLTFDQDDPQDTWVQVSYAATVPANIRIARVVMIAEDASTTNGPIYFDSASATRNGGDNQLLNPSFESGPGGLDGIDDWSEFPGYLATQCLARKSTYEVPAQQGSATLRIVGSCIAGIYQAVAVEPGETFTVSAYLRSKSADPFNDEEGPRAGVKVEWWNADREEWRPDINLSGGPGPVVLTLDNLHFDDSTMDVSGYLGLDTEGRFNEDDVQALEGLLGSQDPNDLRWDFYDDGTIDPNDVDYLNGLVTAQYDSGVFGDWDQDGTADCGCGIRTQITALYDQHPTIMDAGYRIEFDYNLDGALGEDDRGQFAALACPTVPPCTGDMNCDCAIDLGDINPFSLYLSNLSSWQAAHPGCNPANGDINGDGTYPSFGDLNSFVSLLSSQPLPIPCP